MDQEADYFAKIYGCLFSRCGYNSIDTFKILFDFMTRDGNRMVPYLSVASWSGLGRDRVFSYVYYNSLLDIKSKIIDDIFNTCKHEEKIFEIDRIHTGRGYNNNNTHVIFCGRFISDFVRVRERKMNYILQ